MARITGCLTGCLTRLVFWGVAATVFTWVLLVVLHPWALHIGGRSTPLLYWHGIGSVHAEGGKIFPLYVSFFPGRPGGRSSRRQGKTASARLQGRGWLCTAPGTVERMTLTGMMYGGYISDSDSFLSFRLLQRRPLFSIKPPPRGFFDLEGTWHGADLVMDQPGEQGNRFNSGLFIHHAIATLRWGSYGEFEAACNATR